MVQWERVVRRVKRLHVPLIDEPAGQVEPRLFGELVPRVGRAGRDPPPVPSRELRVVENDLDHIGAHVRLEQGRGDRSVAGVTKAQLTAQPSERKDS